MNPNLEPIYQGIVSGEKDAVCEGVAQALSSGQGPETILQDALIPAMREVGRLFEEGEYFLPEMLIAARAMKAGMALLEPLLVAGDVKPVGKVVVGTVEGDLHDIGKNLVATMLTGVGFEVVDLGADVKAARFVEAVKEGGVDFVAMSALLSTTVVHMKKTIDALTEAGLRDQVKVIVGGAPLTEKRALELGADGFSEDASRAATLLSAMVGGR